jgi:hypothetical protein
MSIIFQKLPKKNPQNNWMRIDSIDYESVTIEKNLKKLTDSIAYTGEKSNFLSPELMYGIDPQTKLNEITDKPKIIFRSRINVLLPQETDANKLLFVFEIREKSERLYRYVVSDASYFNPEPGKWFEMSMVTPLLTDTPDDGFIKTFLWYQGEGTIYADDMILDYILVNSE